MSREFTHEYNALFSAHKLVIDRLFKAEFRESNNSWNIPLLGFQVGRPEEGTSQVGELHLLITAPELDFPAETLRFLVEADIDGRVFSLPGYTLLDPYDIEALSCNVDIRCNPENVDGNLRIDFASAEVSIRNMHTTPNTDEARHTTWSTLVHDVIQLALSTQLGDLGNVPITLSQFNILRSITTDPWQQLWERMVFEEPRWWTEHDHTREPIDPYTVNYDLNVDAERGDENPSLNLAFFEEIAEEDLRDDFEPYLEGETRGSPSEVVDTLEENTLFNIKLSPPVLDRLVANGIRQRFMRFAIVISEIPQVFRHRGVQVSEIFIGSETDSESETRVIVSSYRDTVGERYYSQSNIRKGYILNLTKIQNGENVIVEFNTGEDGFFVSTIDAEVGDTLVFMGTSYEKGGNIILPPDTVTLEEGHIRMQGKAEINMIGDKMVDTTYDMSVVLRLDPMTGRLSMIPTVEEWDIPTWCDILVHMLMGFVTVIPGLGQGSITRLREDISGGISEAESTGGDISEHLGDIALHEALAIPDRMAVFPQGIHVSPDGIAITGQIEAGNIRSSGIELGNEEEDCSGRFLIDTLSVQQGWATVTHNAELTLDVSGDETTSTITVRSTTTMRPLDGLALSYLGRAYSFEEIDVDLLAHDVEYEAREHQYVIDRTAPEVFSFDDISGHVFAVRTPWKSYAKVQIDYVPRLFGGAGLLVPLVKWVTYEPLEEPTITILGDWFKDVEDSRVEEGRWVIITSGGNLYWAEHTEEIDGANSPVPGFALEIAGFHEPRIHYTWTIRQGRDGPALHDVPGLEINPHEKILEFSVETNLLPESFYFPGDVFEFYIEVEVEDIFGRRATTSTYVIGSKFSEVQINRADEFWRQAQLPEEEDVRIPEPPELQYLATRIFARKGNKKILSKEAEVAQQIVDETAVDTDTEVESEVEVDTNK
jgi:hypothetical protein